MNQYELLILYGYKKFSLIKKLKFFIKIILLYFFLKKKYNNVFINSDNTLKLVMCSRSKTLTPSSINNILVCEILNVSVRCDFIG